MTTRKLRLRGSKRRCDRQLDEQRRRLALVAHQSAQGLARISGGTKPACTAPDDSKPHGQG
ncbi:MAG: hypothetical protein EKK65_03490 [Lysobacterales bacterium]|nr:MAG: hypothetical protein EKK65_03490 [Xanthomonadales bacterium]